MPSTALPRNVEHYLHAIDAAAVFVTMPLHVGAATIPIMKRMPRSTSFVWIAWTRKIEDAQRIVGARAPAHDEWPHAPLLVLLQPAELIRVLVERPDQLPAALLTQRLRETFSWYVWYQ